MVAMSPVRREQLQISVVHWPEKCLDLNKAVQGFTHYDSFMKNTLKFDDATPGAPVRILQPPNQESYDTSLGEGEEVEEA